MWSLGVILYMLVTGRAPFHEANDSETLTMILDCKFFLPPHVSEPCCDLITRMIVRQPEHRLGLEQISTHEWLVMPRSSSTFDDEHDHLVFDDVIANLTTTTTTTTHANSLRLLESNESSGGEEYNAACYLQQQQRRRSSSKRSSSGGSCSSLTITAGTTTTNGKQEKQQPVDMEDNHSLNNPLIKRENLTENDNREILKLMVNGNIASEQEICRLVNIKN